MGAWLDGYTHITDNGHSGGGTYAGYPWRVVFHTIEGGLSESMARNHNSPPHLWVNPLNGTKIQTVPLDRSSYAMWDQSDYPYRTNKGNAIQIEIAGYAAEAGGWPDSTLRWLASEVLVPIVAFIRSQGGTFDYAGCPDPTTEQISGSSYENAPQRFGWERWANFNSHCGHRHVTGNGDRYDPGLLDLRKISRYAQGGEPTQPPTSSGGVLDFMATNDQAWKLLNDIWNYLQAFHAEAAQQHSDVGGAFAELRTGRGHQDAASQQRHSDVAGAFAELRTGRTAQNVELGHLTHLDPGTSKLADANLSDTGRLAALQTSVDDIEPGTGSGGGIPRAELIAAIKEALQGAKITF